VLLGRGSRRGEVVGSLTVGRERLIRRVTRTDVDWGGERGKLAGENRAVVYGPMEGTSGGKSGES